MHFAVLLINFGYSIRETLAAPRIHCETSEPFQLEKRAGEDVLARVRELGHELSEVSGIGGPAHGIVSGKTTDEYDGATDPRGKGKVAIE